MVPFFPLQASKTPLCDVQHGIFTGADGSQATEGNRQHRIDKIAGALNLTVVEGGVFILLQFFGLFFIVQSANDLLHWG